MLDLQNSKIFFMASCPPGLIKRYCGANLILFMCVLYNSNISLVS